MAGDLDRVLPRKCSRCMHQKEEDLVDMGSIWSNHPPIMDRVRFGIAQRFARSEKREFIRDLNRIGSRKTY